jgi:UPF0271 protein
MKLDINCDLGEGEPLSRTRALMRWITSANVACGGHAGDGRTMEACARLAKQFGVRLGAHPGPWSRVDMGRGPVEMGPDELELLLLQQVSALEQVARASRVPLHHIKLHGALYHASEEDGRLARRYAAVVKRYWPSAVVYARAGGRVARLARGAGLVAWEEVFAERGYRDDGALIPRGQGGAVLADARLVAARLGRWLRGGVMTAASGGGIRLDGQTICIHADTPQAVRIARTVAQVLGRMPNRR